MAEKFIVIVRGKDCKKMAKPAEWVLLRSDPHCWLALDTHGFSALQGCYLITHTRSGALLAILHSQAAANKLMDLLKRHPALAYRGEIAIRSKRIRRLCEKFQENQYVTI